MCISALSTLCTTMCRIVGDMYEAQPDVFDTHQPGTRQTVNPAKCLTLPGSVLDPPRSRASQTENQA